MTLQEHLDKHGLSRERFAAKVPCSEEHITRIINRMRAPSYPMALRIIRAANNEVTLAELFSGESSSKHEAA